MNTPSKILLIDTDKQVTDELSAALAKEGYTVYVSENSSRAIQLFHEEAPHLILLEVLIPEMDGIEICIELRQQPETLSPLIAFYTSRAEDYSQEAAFNAGADDYIIKPVKTRVLLSRIKALLKRNNALRQFDLQPASKGLNIDRERYLVYNDGNELVLPRKEFELLALLFSSPRKVFTRREITRKVWGADLLPKNRTIDVHIRKLREKLGDNYIKTIKGIGYSLQLQPDA